MSYIVLSSGSRALLTDVLRCCLLQRKYRTPLRVSVGPSFTFLAGEQISESHVWFQSLLGTTLPPPPRFDGRHVWCPAMDKKEREREGYVILNLQV